jgi:hypothetical protein
MAQYQVKDADTGLVWEVPGRSAQQVANEEARAWATELQSRIEETTDFTLRAWVLLPKCPECGGRIVEYSPEWIAVIAICEDGHETIVEDSAEVSEVVHPLPPTCKGGGTDHDWKQTGVWGHGAGVAIQEECTKCHARRIEDTRPGYEGIAYEAAPTYED